MGVIVSKSKRRRPKSSSVAPSAPETIVKIDTFDQEPTPDELKELLVKYPEVLDEFVTSSVDIERIREWWDSKIEELQSKHPEQLENIESTASSSSSSVSVESIHGIARFTRSDIYSLMTDITQEIIDADDGCKFMSEMSNILALAVRADNYFFYLLRKEDEQLVLRRCNADGTLTDCTEYIRTGTSVACKVARMKRVFVLYSEAPTGRCRRDRVGNTLCLPLLSLDGEVIGIIKLQRLCSSPFFIDGDIQVATAITAWAGCLFSLGRTQRAGSTFQNLKLTKFLLEVSKTIFDNIICIDTLTSHIMTFAKRLASADRCCFFMVDEVNQELYVELFDEGNIDEDGNPVYSKKERIRFPIYKGIAGLVAKNLSVVNIHDAYKESRFYKDVDDQTGYKTKNILCIPVLREEKIIGVVQLINKLDGEHFTDIDESNLRAFTVYCSLAVHYHNVYSNLKRQQAQNRVALDQLSYYIQASEKEVEEFIREPLPVVPDGFGACSFYHTGPDTELPGLVVRMEHELFDNVSGYQFDPKKVRHFILTVRKNYRPVAYHNWEHCFIVTHCMYWMLKQIPGQLTKLEEQALFIGCICHDLDHRGFNNSFMQKLEHPLASLYATSVMEQHHYNMAISILQQDDHDIFQHLDKESYRLVLEELRKAIIATDLTLYCDQLKEITANVDKDEYDHENTHDRNLLKATMVVGCDLSAMCKSWDVVQRIVRNLYREFYEQGDKEKLMGFTPLPMLDRDNMKNIPKEQVGFIDLFCLPVYNSLAKIFPDSDLVKLSESCREVRSSWERLAEDSEKSDKPVFEINLPSN